VTDAFDVRFVRSAPDRLDDGVLYVSMEHAAVLHLCPCGCGHQVVLELAPRHYTLSYDGIGVTLAPSVGNWSFPCRSHYFIRDNRVVWAEKWTDARVATARARELTRVGELDAHPQQEAFGWPRIQWHGRWWSKLFRRGTRRD
jgi:hypothetical protein